MFNYLQVWGKTLVSRIGVVNPDPEDIREVDIVNIVSSDLVKLC